MNAMPDEFELSRRKALAALGTVGIASAGAGLGTSAFFSDQETFENTLLTAGTLDANVSWEEHYSDRSEDEAEHARMADGELVIDDHERFTNATLQEQFPDKPIKKELDQGTADSCDVPAGVPADLFELLSGYLDYPNDQCVFVCDSAGDCPPETTPDPVLDGSYWCGLCCAE